ncbi:uncharacterized protein LOC144452862 [Glandiceps talaboti]
MATIQKERRVEYWESRADHCDGIQKVMNYACAEEMTRLEIPEILAELPPLKDKTVLELGAGIGRFTCALAKEAKHVTAVDLIERFTEENRVNNAHLGNIDFVTSDAASLEVSQKYDIVFSNFLLQYLDEEECRNVVLETISWLKDGGYAFFRESAKDERDMPGPPKANASLYRHPSFYTDIFNTVRRPVEGDDPTRADLLKILKTQSVKCVTLALAKEVDTHQFWLLQKVATINGKEAYVNGVNGTATTNGTSEE